jgi:CHASE2 domain-containing sensor protein
MNTPSPIEYDIVQERLRQARCSFNLALVATGVSAGVGLAGAGLLLSGKFPEGTVTAAGGLASSACCIRFAKDSNDRLDKILQELND